MQEVQKKRHIYLDEIDDKDLVVVVVVLVVVVVFVIVVVFVVAFVVVVVVGFDVGVGYYGNAKRKRHKKKID